jgi:hypothetical protein
MPAADSLTVLFLLSRRMLCFAHVMLQRLFLVSCIYVDVLVASPGLVFYIILTLFSTSHGVNNSEISRIASALTAGTNDRNFD